MFTLNKKSIQKTILFFCIAVFGAYAAPKVAKSLAETRFTGGFVIPTFWQKNNGKMKKFVLLGKEAGGRDKGTYCAGGGSRDHGEKPWDTSAREFREEMLCQWSQKRMVDHIDPKNGNTECVAVCSHFNSKKNTVVGYITQFDLDTINDIKQNFHQRRNKVSVWNWCYREMHTLATIAWDDLVQAILSTTETKSVQVRAMVIDYKTNKESQEMITLRPIQVIMLRGYLKDQKNNTKSYEPGLEPKVRFY